MITKILNELGKPKILLGITLILFLIAAYFSLTFRYLHDYSMYVKQWAGYLNSGHPYLNAKGTFNGNGYGPLYIPLAYLYQIDTHLPRLLFTILWFLTGGFLVYKAYKNPSLGVGTRLAIWSFLFINPFFFSFYVFYGNNEIVVAFFLVLGIHFLRKNQEIPAGIMFGLGTLFKFIPIFIIPFLFFGERKIRALFFIWFVLTFSIGYEISWLLWDQEILEPFIFGTGRPAKFMSIFRHLESDYSLLRVFFDNPDPARFSFPLMLLALFGLFLFHLRHRMSILVTATTVLTLCYTFYKVNHLQFHTNILVLFVFWYIVDYQQINKTQTSLAPMYWYVGIVSGMQFFYVYFRYMDVNFDALRDIIGLPFFFVCSWTVGRFLEYTLNLRKKPPVVIIKTPPLTIKQHLN
jgi:Gpi18-like mannosyltransferase